MIRFLLLSATLVGLSACGNTWFGADEAAPLAGDRQPVLAQRAAALPPVPETAADFSASEVIQDIQPAALEDVWNNAFWPQAGGYPNHAMQHVALSYPLQRGWSRSIGRGGDAEIPLIAQPVTAEEVIVTLDAKGFVRAFSTDGGRQIWSADARVEGEDETVIGGGVALSAGSVYVTAGYNEVLSLSVSDGTVQWRSPLSTPARAAPTVAEGRVFVVTLDNRLTALSANTGTRLWQHQGLETAAGLLGMAAPAVTDDLAFAAYSNGEIYALNVESGASIWSDNLSALTRRGSRASLSDIRALPVVDKGMVFVVSASGRTVAIDERTGNRVWETGIGGTQTPFVSGNRVFLIDRDARLVALDRVTGRLVWETQLQPFEDMEDREEKITWSGPLLAGGNLIAFSNARLSAVIDPISGDIIGDTGVNIDTTIPPIVAGGVLYLLSTNGTLTAWQ